MRPGPADRGSATALRPKLVGEPLGARDSARDGLASLLAHDLKTPLAAISMNLDFVLSELPADTVSGALRAALDDCRSANTRAIRILSDVADALRLQSGDRHPTLTELDIRTLLTNVARRATPEATARGVRLLWTSDTQHVRGDEDLLERTLERLLERALRHARIGGSIEIALTAGTLAIRVRSSTGSESRDVTPESAARGLAMHFAEAAMRAQGGAVWTEADADGSLLFCVRLPEP